MSAEPLQDDDEESNVIPIPPCPTDFREFRTWTQNQIISLHKSDQKQWRWIWIVTGGIGIAGYIIGESGIIQRLAGG